MDGSRFDALTRSLAARQTRRGALKALAAAAVGGLLAARGAGRALADHASDHCAKAGQQTQPKKQCCAGLAECADGRCAPFAGVACQSRPPAEDPACAELVDPTGYPASCFCALTMGGALVCGGNRPYLGATPCGRELPPCPAGWFCYDGGICLPYCVAAA